MRKKQLIQVYNLQPSCNFVMRIARTFIVLYFRYKQVPIQNVSIENILTYT